MTVAGSTFTNNTTAGGGGAVGNYGSSTKIDRSVFTNNQAEFYGGAIINSRGDLRIWDSKRSAMSRYVRAEQLQLSLQHSDGDTLANSRAESGGAIAMGTGGLGS
jgi:hypothetical protein